MDFIVDKIVEATAYHTTCPNCGHKNMMKDFNHICPKCGRDLKCYELHGIEKSSID